MVSVMQIPPLVRFDPQAQVNQVSGAAIAAKMISDVVTQMLTQKAVQERSHRQQQEQAKLDSQLLSQRAVLERALNNYYQMRSPENAAALLEAAKVIDPKLVDQLGGPQKIIQMANQWMAGIDQAAYGTSQPGQAPASSLAQGFTPAPQMGDKAFTPQASLTEKKPMFGQGLGMPETKPLESTVPPRPTNPFAPDAAQAATTPAGTQSQPPAPLNLQPAASLQAPVPQLGLSTDVKSLQTPATPTAAPQAGTPPTWVKTMDDLRTWNQMTTKSRQEFVNRGFSLAIQRAVQAGDGASYQRLIQNRDNYLSQVINEGQTVEGIVAKYASQGTEDIKSALDEVGYVIGGTAAYRSDQMAIQRDREERLRLQADRANDLGWAKLNQTKDGMRLRERLANARLEFDRDKTAAQLMQRAAEFNALQERIINEGNYEGALREQATQLAHYDRLNSIRQKAEAEGGDPALLKAIDAQLSTVSRRLIQLNPEVSSGMPMGQSIVPATLGQGGQPNITIYLPGAQPQGVVPATGSGAGTSGKMTWGNKGTLLGPSGEEILFENKPVTSAVWARFTPEQKKAFTGAPEPPKVSPAPAVPAVPPTPEQRRDTLIREQGLGTPSSDRLNAQTAVPTPKDSPEVQRELKKLYTEVEARYGYRLTGEEMKEAAALVRAGKPANLAANTVYHRRRKVVPMPRR